MNHSVDRTLVSLINVLYSSHNRWNPPPPKLPDIPLLNILGTK
jgi:hypothetical protein